MKCFYCGVAEGNTKHHTEPKSLGGKETVAACETCHSFIHSKWTNKELKFMTHEEVLEGMEKFLTWRRKHGKVSSPSKMSKRIKRKR